MSKRIIYQCDKCHKMKEQESQPADWPSMTATYTPADLGSYNGGYQSPDEHRLWCAECWRDIRQPHAKAATARDLEEFGRRLVKE